MKYALKESFEKNKQMKTITFKTNMKCGGCVATATPYLDNAVGTAKWKVDTATADKVLTVENADVAAQRVIDAVKEAGFTAEEIK